MSMAFVAKLTRETYCNRIHSHKAKIAGAARSKLRLSLSSKCLSAKRETFPSRHRTQWRVCLCLHYIGINCLGVLT